MNYVRIAIVGSVSVGKTTAINTLHSTILEKTSRKRSTFETKIYQESPDVTQFTQKADNYILTPVSNHLTVKNKEDFLIRFYDVPGLDDAETKEGYFNWIKTNFKHFDIIIYILDIERGFNTDGEMSILKLLFSLNNEWYSKCGKTTFIIPVINKCDNVQFINNKYTFFDDELCTMYSDIKKTLSDMSKEYKIENFVKNAIPISFEEAFIYRYIQQHGFNAIDNLDTKYINKIGVNEFGVRQWSNEQNKNDKIKKYFSDCSIEELIKTTTYNKFIMILNTLIEKNRHIILTNPYSIFQINYTLDNLSSILEHCSLLEKLETTKHITTNSSTIVKQLKEMISGAHQGLVSDAQTVDKLIHYQKIILLLENINCKTNYKTQIYDFCNLEFQSLFNSLVFSNVSILIEKLTFKVLINTLNDYQHLFNYFYKLYTLDSLNTKIVEDYYEFLFGNNQSLLDKFTFKIDKGLLLNGLLKMLLIYPQKQINVCYFVIYLELSLSSLEKYKQAYFKVLINKITKKYDSINSIMDTDDLIYPTEDLLKTKISTFL
jgi:signal recognition particle receptor subunit beta